MVELLKKNAVIQSDVVYETALRVRPDHFLFESTHLITSSNAHESGTSFQTFIIDINEMEFECLSSLSISTTDDIQNEEGNDKLSSTHDDKQEEEESALSTEEERAETFAEALITYMSCLELLRRVSTPLSLSPSDVRLDLCAFKRFRELNLNLLQ